jgi:hypothetical protein
MMLLPNDPVLSDQRRRALERVFEATRHNPPPNLTAIIRLDLGIDLSTQYAGVPIPHPFGKGAGQLSYTVSQVQDDAAAGVAFVVLKTVVAENAAGERSMDEWVNPETRMQVERRTSASGRDGWTVTWVGRGWSGTLSEYQKFYEQSLQVGADAGMVVVPSVQYHLPGEGESYNEEEYRHTTQSLIESWKRAGGRGEMLLEKDFSPTVAGDERAKQQERILHWVREVPALLRAVTTDKVRLGLKVMNAVFEDEFQMQMLDALTVGHDGGPDFLVVFNRLFDAQRGVAFGGWDLSDRNLRVLDAARSAGLQLPPLSATGNICSGKMMVEYALRGCENGQLHTFFQLPRSEYTATDGSRSRLALHTLLLHPTRGLVPWIWHLNETGRLNERDGTLYFRDIVTAAGG